MEITPEGQYDTDFDWFCVDESGAIGHFTTAGFKGLPPSVAASSEDLDRVVKYFDSLVPHENGHDLDSNLPDRARNDRYLRSFIAMADRGIFSFDIASYLEPGIEYFRVAIPKTPLRLVDLPDAVRVIVARTVLKEKLLSLTARIGYEETLTM